MKEVCSGAVAPIDDKKEGRLGFGCTGGMAEKNGGEWAAAWNGAL